MCAVPQLYPTRPGAASNYPKSRKEASSSSADFLQIARQKLECHGQRSFIKTAYSAKTWGDMQMAKTLKKETKAKGLPKQPKHNMQTTHEVAPVCRVE
eukprot:2492040-Amphidinium_carterae.1